MSVIVSQTLGGGKALRMTACCHFGHSLDVISAGHATGPATPSCQDTGLGEMSKEVTMLGMLT